MKFGIRDIIYLVIIIALCGVIYFLFRLDKTLEAEIATNKKLLHEHFDEIYTSVQNLESHRDTSIAEKAKEVKQKIDDLKDKLSNKNISDFEKERLKNELIKVKKEFDDYQSNIMFNMIDMIDAKDNEISVLNHKVVRFQKQLENCDGSTTTTIINDKVQTQKILAALNMNVVPLNRKNSPTYKARYTDAVQCDFKISGDLNSLGFKYIYIEVTDHTGKKISTEKDKIEITKKDLTYIFKPENYDFRSGKYTVKAMSENSEFESIFSFTLSNKF